MAPKRPPHLDDPPAADSSGEEEVSSEDEEVPSEAEQDKTPKKASTLASEPSQPPESSSESDPGESAAPTTKRQRSRPAAKDSKRPKKKKISDAGGETEAASEDEPKKSSAGGDEKKLFQRLWSLDDEIAILKGVIDYAAKGSDPSADMGAFHNFIRKSLGVDVSKTQLTDKVRRLRKKFEKNSAKKSYDPSNPHEKKAFELSKKIWGRGDNGDDPKSNGAVPKSGSRSKRKTLPSLKAELLSSEIGGGGGGSGSEIFGFGKSFPGLDLVLKEKKAELEAKWKKIHVAELELVVKRTELISEQGKLILEALNSSGR